MNATVVFLAVRMARGFGVPVVVDELAKRLENVGLKVVVGCLENDEAFDTLDVRVVEPTISYLRAFLRNIKADVVIAKTTPYFELLPHLTNEVTCIAWEQGDPSPELFDHDRALRAQIARHKRETVYGKVHAVIASTRFLREDIGWPSAHVIPLGCDHVGDLGPKPLMWRRIGNGRRLRVGTLMRLGEGEARYKGNQLFLSLGEHAAAMGLNADFCVMGRGTESDARDFERAGFNVHLNASDSQRAGYLRSLDVFVSCSLWEGFNLPLVEAQALGTVALAFDTGAHPEVTPFIMSSFDDMLQQIGVYSCDPELLERHSRAAYDFVRRKFSWDIAARRLQEHIFATVA